MIRRLFCGPPKTCPKCGSPMRDVISESTDGKHVHCSACESTLLLVALMLAVPPEVNTIRPTPFSRTKTVYPLYIEIRGDHSPPGLRVIENGHDITSTCVYVYGRGRTKIYCPDRPWRNHTDGNYSFKVSKGKTWRYRWWIVKNSAPPGEGLPPFFPACIVYYRLRRGWNLISIPQYTTT